MKAKNLILPLVLLAALLFAGVVVAQAEVTAEILAPQGAYTVGDPIDLSLTVTHPAGYQVIAPEFEEQWGDFVVQSQGQAETADNGDGTQTTTIAIDARLFAPGEFNTPPLPVTVTDGAGQLLEVTAAATPIIVNSVLVEGDTTLRDIKPQAELPFTNLLPWLAGGLLLALVLGFGYWMWRRHQARLALGAVDNRMPHEVALDELDRIARLGLPEQGRFKEHYSLVADTVRQYLERTYNVPIMERTTGEISAALANLMIDRGTARRVVTFLEESDLVKFADVVPSEASAYELIAQGKLIVEGTKPLVITENDLDSGSGSATVAARAFSSNGHGEKIEVGT